MLQQYQKLKRAVIKEELVALTGSFEKALILNQFLYWTERMQDFDEWLNEENQRRDKNGETPIKLMYGWIYKKAAQLNTETMLDKTEPTILKYLQDLEKGGWLLKRRNPQYTWDKTFQYRVDMNKVDQDLKKLGYVFEGFKARNIAT